MSRLKNISDKLDYIAMGKLNAEQMEYICEINQEVNLKDREIERLNNIINELALLFDDYMSFIEVLEKYNYKPKGSDKE